MQFLILAYDGTDAGALTRRLAMRQSHLEGVRLLKESGNFLEGGAILDDAGQMIGSMLLMEFESRSSLDAWVILDPYTTGEVWRTVEVRPFQRAPV